MIDYKGIIENLRDEDVIQLMKHFGVTDYKDTDSAISLANYIKNEKGWGLYYASSNND